MKPIHYLLSAMALVQMTGCGTESNRMTRPEPIAVAADELLTHAADFE